MTDAPEDVRVTAFRAGVQILRECAATDPARADAVVEILVRLYKALLPGSHETYCAECGAALGFYAHYCKDCKALAGEPARGEPS